MSEQTAGDQKLVQYLNEAYGKEKELEAALGAHIEMTNRAPFRKRLQQHRKETRNHAKLVERRIKKLGGDGSKLKDAAGKAAALAKAPGQALRGTGDEEKLLKNAKSAYSDEAEEIATYTAIEALAETVGDKETAKVARQIRREEERMASFLEKQIPVLTRAVAQAEIPASERNGGRSRSSSRSRSSRARSTRSRSGGSKSTSARSTRSKSSATGSTRRSSGSKSSRSSSARSRSSRR